MAGKKQAEEVIPKKIGRPTNYKPEYCEKLIEHMRNGYSFESFGATINVSRDNVYEWAKVHAEFSEAKKQALDQSLLYWERLGHEGMWHGGKDQPSFNSTLWIFNMKNRHKWSDNKEVAITTPANNAPQIIVSLPDNGRSAPEKKD